MVGSEIINALRKAELLDQREDKTYVAHNWQGRQFITDTKDRSGTPAAIKSKRYRDKEEG